MGMGLLERVARLAVTELVEVKGDVAVVARNLPTVVGGSMNSMDTRRCQESPFFFHRLILKKSHHHQQHYGGQSSEVRQ